MPCLACLVPRAVAGARQLHACCPKHRRNAFKHAAHGTDSLCAERTACADRCDAAGATSLDRLRTFRVAALRSPQLSWWRLLSQGLLLTVSQQCAEIKQPAANTV